jgi:ATP-dependent DNA helicase RecG
MKDEGFISTIELGRFQSETLIKDSKRIKTDLFTEVEESFAYIKKFINKETVLNGNLHRKEEWDYPLDAIRELIVNCIVHRDYRQSSDTVIKIFDNKIEIFNPGKLLDGITIDKILKGNYNSVIRNKKIADIFKEAGLIEKYGSGLKRVIESLKKTKKHKIKFSESDAGFKVEVIKTHLKTPLKTHLKTTLKKKGDLTELENKIFNQITNNIKITYNEIAENLGISRNTVLEYIRKLKLKKVISRKGSKRNGYWKILG